jgi:hypothetical protein
MTKRQHVDLDKAVCSVFGKLFGFEKVGILFVDGVEADPNAPNIFKINHLPQPPHDEDLTEYDRSKGYSGTVNFPKNIGITGDAIQKQKVIVLRKGERASNFASELDNMVSVVNFESMVVGPVFDADGICRGALQFVNK